jgi:predicted Ser/Thr protein kinase
LGGLCPACLLRQGASAETATQGETTPFVPPDVAEVTRLFPQLEILAFIGKGGMGAVYKARQPALDRLVALKLLPPQVAGGPGFAERFAREARALAKLNHPNIVAVYEFGQVNGLPFFLMEFVDGLNLRELERAGKLSPREALQIVPQICEALQFAHDEGVVHRDIKPENILIDKKGRVKIADFGIAKIMGAAAPDPAAGAGPAPAASASEQSRLTEEGKIVGTPNYMAPEQVETPQSVDHRADIFSLGVVFYEMLTGELPLGKFAPPSSRIRGVTVDVRLDEVVLRALEKEPDRRYQQASQVRTAVQNIAGFPGQSQASFYQQGVEYRSRATLFGLPIVHVATGSDPATGRARVARGIIAIGGIAQGVVAFGGIAMGGLTFGGLSVGVVAFGGCALGLVSLGGLAIALLASFGGLSIAPIAIGGGAVGYLAFGGGTAAVHPMGANASDEAARQFFMPWAPHVMASATIIFTLLMLLMMTVVIGVPRWLQWRMLASSSGSQFTNQSRLAHKSWAAAALVVTGLSGVLGVVAMSLLPYPPRFMLWLILNFALTGLVLGVMAHRTRLGRQAIVSATLNVLIWLLIAAVYVLRGNYASFIKSDYVGRAWFPNGDSIEITSVERSNHRMTVKGHYNLVSVGNAQLALYVTSTNDLVIPEDPDQSTNISQGRGEFQLTHSHLVPGLPHVSIYANGRSVAALYFGTPTEALEESRAVWITNTPPAIASPPANQAVLLGGNATFSVSAVGAAPLSYQWMVNGKSIPAAANATLTLAGVQTNQSGNNYSVRVSNGAGTTNSAGAALTVIKPVPPSTNDLWDISRGTIVTGSSGIHAPYSDIRDMFGGAFSPIEPGNTVFDDGRPDGFVHYVEWQTPGPVTVGSFALFASGDPKGYNYQREFSRFVLKARSSAQAADYDLTLYTLEVTSHPYTFVDPLNCALLVTNITPVTAQYFRAEFTQHDAGRGYDGPRVIELDGFGANPPGLVAWWAAEGNANDSIGTNHGVLMNGAGFVAGEAGQAFCFNGSNQYVMVPGSSSLNVGAGGGFTIDCWINPADVSAPQPVFEWDSDPNSDSGTGVHMWISIPTGAPAGGPGCLFANLKNPDYNFILSTGAGVVTNAGFQHVALSYDKASRVARLYCNGAMVAQGWSPVPDYPPATTGEFDIGKRICRVSNPGGPPGKVFAGLIDEMHIFNRALSEAEIQAIYDAGGAGNGPLPPQ